MEIMPTGGGGSSDDDGGIIDSAIGAVGSVVDGVTSTIGGIWDGVTGGSDDSTDSTTSTDDTSTSDDDYGTGDTGPTQDTEATENVDDGSDMFNLTKEKVLGVLGIGAGTWATLTEFATDPLDFILWEILPWIVGGILDGWSTVLGAFLSAFEPLTTIPSLLADPLGTAGGVIFDAVLVVIGTINGAVVGVAQSTGPFAPLVVGGIWIGIGALASAALSAIPIYRVPRMLLGVIRA